MLVGAGEMVEQVLNGIDAHALVGGLAGGAYAVQGGYGGMEVRHRNSFRKAVQNSVAPCGWDARAGSRDYPTQADLSYAQIKA